MKDQQSMDEKQRIYADWKTLVNKAFVQATHDPLTGLPNRALFYDRLQVAISESVRHHEIMAVMFVDLDHFKKINDEWGHDVGDQVLVSQGMRLSKVLRTEDTLARLGGDEFVILVRRLRSIEEAEVVATRVMKTLDHPFYKPLPIKESLPVVTASVGMSFCPFDGEDLPTLLRCADEAMYRVKKKGGAGFEFYNRPISLKSGSGPDFQKGSPKILIIDDDVDFYFILQKVFQGHGYECCSATGVDEALHEIGTVAPDLVILDLGFKGPSGLSFLEKLTHSLRNGQKIPPVLVMSGYEDPELIEIVTTLGASGFLSKMTASRDVLAAVQNLLH